MKSMINLSTGSTTITGISSFSLCLEAVEGFCKLKSYKLLTDPFVSQKEITVNDLLIFDRPL
jgi:hypothetical protein